MTKRRTACRATERVATDRLTAVRESAARRLATLPRRSEKPDANERLSLALQRREEADARREAMIERWRHKAEGTPETHEKIAAVPDRQRQSPLHRMERLGKISAEERAAAEQIAGVIERIGRAAAIRSVSLETRVDHAGSGRDHLVESLARVRLEVAYRAWRDAIPEPKAMVLDMVTSNRSFVEQAHKYGLQWRTARKRLMTALRLWPGMMAAARREVGRDDVDEIYRRIGTLTPSPLPSGK